MSQETPVTYGSPGYPLVTGTLPQPATAPTVGPDTKAAPASTPTAPVATSSVSVYSYVPNTAPILSPDTSPYLDYTVQTFYARDMGLRASPSCGPYGTPMDVTRVHGGGQLKIVAWFCRRIGSPPVLPSSAPANANEVLLAPAATPAAPGFLPDGTPIWTCSGFYLYALRTPVQESDMMFGGALPISPLSPSQSAIEPSQWVSGIGNSPVPPALATGLAPITF